MHISVNNQKIESMFIVRSLVKDWNLYGKGLTTMFVINIIQIRNDRYN